MPPTIYKAALVLLAASVLAACATNPVTGRKELSLVSEDWELQVGEQQYAPSRQSQGGDYVADPAVQEYVNAVGQKLAQASDRELPYEFKVLNSSVPNAWALPGGKVAVNRGLLTELKSEAELAAVLGHEITHAAARHGARSASRDVLLQGAVVGATIAASGSRYSNAAVLGATLGAQLISTKYGRDAEREADYYSMGYMSRAGYDPQGAVTLQETFVRLSQNRRQDFLSGLFASHPPSQERVENNRARAAELPPGGELGTERYRERIAHLIETKPAYDAYDKAQQALAQDKPAEARSLVSQAIALEPREGHFYSLLGDIEAEQKNWSAARDQYQKAIERNPNFFYYHLRKGLVNERLNELAAARRDLQRSQQLLPTADAGNALGNIARSQGNLAEAKQFYASAAQHDSPAGRAALGSLLEMDLPENPGAYLQARYQVNANGQIAVQIANTTPRDLSGIVLAVQYPDAQGRVHQSRQSIRGRLPAGQATVVTLPFTIDPALARLVATRVVKAELAP